VTIYSAMAATIDNRMGWIRNLEALATATQRYTVEYELGSECQIPGVLDYADHKIICSAMSTEESKEGLWLYNLILRFPTGPHDINRRANEKGYYFKDDVLGELMALLSLFFRCRFYLISSRLVPENPTLGMTIKTEYPFLRINCNPGIHPPLFENRNKNFATEFKNFLDTVRLLNRELHQSFILACHHYARAAREVGVDPEMVFIRLVSSIEALSEEVTLSRNDDTLEEQKVRRLIDESDLVREHKAELKNIFNVRKSRKKFVRFVEQNSSGFFKGGNFKAKHLKIKRSALADVLDVIYAARSKYLHAGEPMFLSQPFKAGGKWDTDPTSGMIADNRSFTADQKLPYGFFFEGLVRHCLLNYLRKNSVSHVVFAYGSNMCSGRFRDYRMHPEGAGCSALLTGYRLLFNKPSTDSSGKANVELHEGSQVWGVLYSIPDADLTVLDQGEVGYQRVKLSVTTPDGEKHDAWVYIASRPSNAAGLRPFTWYTRFLVEGAREHALPPDYIATLENIETVQDANEGRDRRKRALSCNTEQRSLNQQEPS
jgi:gamma-glutamylcyclotransferase (GGCT)/AIG2-like uncharacterized protein YtfP